MSRKRIQAAFLVLALVALVASGCGPSTTGTPEVNAVPQEQGDPEVLQAIQLGDQYRSSGLPAKAVTEYEKALEKDPENLEIYPRLGYALIEMENFEKAVKVYRRYVDLAPKSCDSHASLAFAYLKQELMDQAIASYEKALELCPEDPNAYVNLGKAYQLANYPVEAIEVFQRAIVLNPDDIPSYERLGDLYFGRKLYPEAIAVYEAILSHPNNGKDPGWITWAEYRLGSMYRWGGACDPAIAHFEQVTAAAGGSDPEMQNRAWRSLAGCYEETGQTALAIEAYERVIAANPENAAFHYRLGELLNDMGRYQEAIDTVKHGQAYDATGCAAHAYCVIGRAYEKLGGIANYSRAEREFKRAVACGDPRFTDYARKQIERQKQLIKIEELKKKKAEQGY
jgi:tetratricopeptide (TPR) repeat protein